MKRNRSIRHRLQPRQSYLSLNTLPTPRSTYVKILLGVSKCWLAVDWGGIWEVVVVLLSWKGVLWLNIMCVTIGWSTYIFTVRDEEINLNDFCSRHLYPRALSRGGHDSSALQSSGAYVMTSESIFCISPIFFQAMHQLFTFKTMWDWLSSFCGPDNRCTQGAAKSPGVTPSYGHTVLLKVSGHCHVGGCVCVHVCEDFSEI